MGKRCPALGCLFLSWPLLAGGLESAWAETKPEGEMRWALQDAMTINFGTFLLMQSPSACSSQEMYARAIEIAQAAEALGFHNVWLAEHHFSTYGYLSRPAQFAT